MLDVLMKVLGDGRVGLFVILLQCQEIVASRVQELCGNLGLAAHGINGHNTAVDRQSLQESRNRRHLIGLPVCLELANAEPAVVRAPGRKHVQRGGRSGPV
jgi:hypothetical protein